MAATNASLRGSAPISSSATDCLHRPGSIQIASSRKPRSGLLSLPPELSGSIYRYCFENKVLLFYRDLDGHPMCDSLQISLQPRPAGFSREGRPPYFHSAENSHRILQVCKEIYLEAQAFFYQSLELSFQPGFNYGVDSSDSSVFWDNRWLLHFTRRWLSSTMSGLAPYKAIKNLGLSELISGGEHAFTTASLAFPLMDLYDLGWPLTRLYLSICDIPLDQHFPDLGRNSLFFSLFRLCNITSVKIRW